VRGHLTMSTKERTRMLACQRIVSGGLGVAGAASMLSISTRQMRRSLRRYEERGDAGLLHASRGSVSRPRHRPGAASCRWSMTRPGYV